MGDHQYNTVIGSGTIPAIQAGPTHNISAGTFPVPNAKDSLRNRRGDGVIVLNPEDFSVSIGFEQQAITVSASATPLPADPLPNRRALVIHNNSAITIYIGNSAVSVANGFPIVAGEKIAIDIMGVPNVTVYAISASSADVRILELA